MELVSDVLVFEDGQGSVCVLSACRGGLFINHIYSSRPGFIFRYKVWLFSLVRELGYGRVFCRPNDQRLWDLYVQRWGFRKDAFGGLVLDLELGNGQTKS
jgi:hypothetical protein